MAFGWDRDTAPGGRFLIAVFTTFALLAFNPAYAVDGTGLFELDGNAVDDTNVGAIPDDWEDINDGTSSALATTTGEPGEGGIIFDPPPGETQDNIFTGGGSKDDLDIPNWRWKIAKPTPDKDNILHAAAAAYEDDGDLIAYFVADRFANNGAADIGFWFLQSELGLNPDGTFSGQHTIGDVLVLADFTRGGALSQIEVFRWNPAGANDGNNNLERITGATFAECDGAGGKDACAISNTGGQVSPWPFDPKFGTNNEFPLNSLFEGGINLTSIFADFGGLPCFASFLAETRSSPSVDATLKDFALGAFPNCSVKISNVCKATEVAADQSSFKSTYDVEVENDGFGTLFDLDVYRVIGENDQTSGEMDDILLGTIAMLGTGDVDDTSFADLMFNTLVNGDTVQTRVEAASSDGGEANVFAIADSSTCPMVVLDPRISATKDCEVKLVTDPGGAGVFLNVEFAGMVCNNSSDGGAALSLDVSAKDDSGTPADPSDDQDLDLTYDGTTATTVTLPDGACATYTSSYVPLSAPSDPSSASFTDQVTATGEASVGSTTSTVMAMVSATCSLCPSNEEQCTLDVCEGLHPECGAP